jgi:hypothetical protein
MGCLSLVLSGTAQNNLYSESLHSQLGREAHAGRYADFRDTARRRVYVVRVANEGGTHRYRDVLAVWRALDEIDPPSGSKSTWLLQASGAMPRHADASTERTATYPQEPAGPLDRLDAWVVAGEH